MLPFLLDFGSHRDQIDVPFLTVAAGLGITRPQIDKFLEVLGLCWKQLTSKRFDRN